MSTNNVLPRQLRKQFEDDFGRDTNRWPEELRDLVNPSIQANPRSAPISGKIEQFLDNNYVYYWAESRTGQNANDDRVQELRWAGWEFATTKDVKMCADSCVRGRNKEGFSDEIRSGDRRLMKIKKEWYKEKRKAENMAAIQMAYPQVYDQTGRPMSTGDFGMPTQFVGDDFLAEMASKRNPSNSDVARIPKS